VVTERTTDEVFRAWWDQTARHGMTASEVFTSFTAALSSEDMQIMRITKNERPAIAPDKS
jgi:hypothetical protein